MKGPIVNRMWEIAEEKQQGLRHGRLRPWASAAAGLVADLFFPPVCAGCGVATGSHRALCGACWSSIRFIERPFCAVLGLPFSYDQGEGAVSPEALAHPPDFDRLRSVAAHDGVVRTLVHALKYRDRAELAPMMAGWMARAGREILAEADAVLPVPLHRSRLFFRRYNQSAELSRRIARLCGISHLPDSLIRRRATGRQVGLSRKARQRNVAGAFAVPPVRRETVIGRRIVLVDDVFTTGATVNAAARALKRAGAAEVSVLTFAMAFSGPI